MSLICLRSSLRLSVGGNEKFHILFFKSSGKIMICWCGETIVVIVTQISLFIRIQRVESGLSAGNAYLIFEIILLLSSRLTFSASLARGIKEKMYFITSNKKDFCGTQKSLRQTLLMNLEPLQIEFSLASIRGGHFLASMLLFFISSLMFFDKSILS